MFLISATNTEAGDQSATDDSHKEAVDAMIQAQREISEELGISQERVGCIIADLDYRKVCARWVPRMLTPEMKASDLPTEFAALRI